ncbi:hypothetical protein AURDEDRAFT_172062 [Auricularia subglabra TFB-10046 SS5]|nr:hypothetical protein AURDEDRAFT_172062 [Auricularia subglabra TFB-10046 SS5]
METPRARHARRRRHPPTSSRSRAATRSTRGASSRGSRAARRALDLDPYSLTLRAPPPGAVLEHYRRLFRRGAADAHNTIVLADDPPAPAPAAAEDAAMSPAEQIRSLPSVSQDLDRVAEMLPRLEESMRARTALANEGLANIHETLAAAPVPVPVGPARVVNDPAQAPLAFELGLPMPAPLGRGQTSEAPAFSQREQLGLAPVPAPVPSTSELGAPAPAPPQPSAIEGSLLDNEHLRFMLGVSASLRPSCQNCPVFVAPGHLQRGYRAHPPTLASHSVGEIASSWFATLSASGPTNFAPASNPTARRECSIAGGHDDPCPAGRREFCASTPARPHLSSIGDLAAQNNHAPDSLEAPAPADTERALLTQC